MLLSEALDSKLPPQEYVVHLGKRGFRLDERIGWGLSGSVYRATQTSLDRPVAVKFGDSAEAQRNAQLRARFEREAKLLALLSHPSIPYVLIAGVVPDVAVPYTVMEFIDGQRLRDQLPSRSSLAPSIAIGLALDLLDALQAAHQANIVHRDVCPENVLVRSGRCVLIDFSIGVELNGKCSRETNTGDHLGRAAYMSPEQQQDMGSVDGRSDVYSTAVLLLEMLTGSPGLAQLSADGFADKYSNGLRDVLLKGLAHERDARFTSAVAFGEELRRLELNRVGVLTGPITAICSSTTCPRADWTDAGYYRGPSVFRDCTDGFCTSCGTALKRSCDGCGAPYKETPHCGACGRKWYSVPTCKTCGSWLKVQDMNRDTLNTCCSRGDWKASTKNNLDRDPYDDIPF